MASVFMIKILLVERILRSIISQSAFIAFQPTIKISCFFLSDMEYGYWLQYIYYHDKLLYLGNISHRQSTTHGFVNLQESESMTNPYLWAEYRLTSFNKIEICGILNKLLHKVK